MIITICVLARPQFLTSRLQPESHKDAIDWEPGDNTANARCVYEQKISLPEMVLKLAYASDYIWLHWTWPDGYCLEHHTTK